MADHLSTATNEEIVDTPYQLESFAEAPANPDQSQQSKAAKNETGVGRNVDLSLANRKLLAEQDYQLPSHNTLISGRNGFKSVHKWEGVVTALSEDGEDFTASLTDLKNGGAKEEVTLPVEEVSEQDRPLLQLGALFYWNIGYEKTNGQIKKASIIRFKRLPKWSNKDWDSILDKANELEKGIEWK
jgi:hypothetical protein